MRIDDHFKVSLPIDETWKVFLDVERIAPCMPGAELQEVTDDEFRGVVKIKLGAITARYKGIVRFEEVDEAGHRLVLRAEARETKGQGNAAATVVATLRPSPDGGTEVSIDTDLKISGRVAQFGRGVMADVSSKLLGQFASCLEADLAKEFDKGQEPKPSEPKPGESASGESVEASTEPGEFATGDSATDKPMPGEPAPSSPKAESAPVGQADATEPTKATTGAGPGPSSSRVVDARPAEPLDLLAVAGGSMAQRGIPIALGADLLLLAVVKGTAKRRILAGVGLGLVAALVTRQG